MTAVIEANNLVRRFDDLVAVDGISYRVSAGEIFGFLGHNGAGKTTTVRLMNGVLKATAGELEVLGLSPYEDGSELRQRTGVLTEAPSLDERLTARENLTFYAHLYAVPEDQVSIRVQDLLQRFDLAARANDKVGGYSKGMKQRLALARALIHRPELLFLDEPTAGLDPMAAREVHALIRQLRLAGRTIFMCTHNLIEAQRLCDRVAVLRQGRIVAMGTVAELSARIGGGQELEIEVHEQDLDRALSLLESAYGESNVRRDRTLLVIDRIEKGRIPAALERLVTEGIRVYRLTPQEPSLEDVYFGLHQEGGAS
ncbi:MAG: ATP-binding cassette domain-containing protein [Anaerolineales bacterium]